MHIPVPAVIAAERSAVHHNPWFLELYGISGRLVRSLKIFQHDWNQVIIMECTWPGKGRWENKVTGIIPYPITLIPLNSL